MCRKKKERTEDKIDKNKRNLENAKKEYEKPWSYEKEYEEKLAKLNELNNEYDREYI